MVNGALEKHDGKPLVEDIAAVEKQIESTVEYLQTELGDASGQQAMNPDAFEEKPLDGSRTYTNDKDASDYEVESERWRA